MSSFQCFESIDFAKSYRKTLNTVFLSSMGIGQQFGSNCAQNIKIWRYYLNRAKMASICHNDSGHNYSQGDSKTL